MKLSLRLFLPVLIAVCAALYASSVYAAPGDCDGTSGDDTVVCSSDPGSPDEYVGLDLGDDTYIQDEGVTSEYVGGDSLDDGTEATGNGGNDTLVINGDVNSCVDGDNVTGNGGNDRIVVNGSVGCEVNGDYVGGDGGNDHITINGTVAHDVSGDYSDGNGGDDTIVVNGYVGGDVYGDSSLGDGGSDTFIINGTVAGEVYGDDLGAPGGDDYFIIGADAVIGGGLYGDDGYDTLEFTSVLQSILDGLNPSGGSLTFNGHTYTWHDFEQLIGYIAELHLRVFHSANGLVAVDVGDGVRIFNGNGLVAFVSFASLKSMQIGDVPLMYQSPNHSQGWYVLVSRVSADDFLVQIYDAGNSLQSQFTFNS
jgi:hypothetical protein